LLASYPYQRSCQLLSSQNYIQTHAGRGHKAYTPKTNRYTRDSR
jgi:hypothetical protein